MTDRPGWARLVGHSYRIGFRWLFGSCAHGFHGARGGLNRLLVPLDPWRFYEMGRLADESFAGRCLDVSSPKLLPSLLAHEGKGTWTAVDLFAPEIECWQRLDPSLHLEVQDARALTFPDASFDHVLCVSVIEHIAGDGDTKALSEIWRVLRPGGRLDLTTNVALQPREIWTERRIWGAAQEERDGRVFFERHYDPALLEARLLRRPWDILHREWAAEIDGRIEDVFYGLRPASYLLGGFLRFVCPGNFRVSDSPDVLQENRHGVVWLQLRKTRVSGGGAQAD